MKPLINNNSAIRAVFEGGKCLAAIHGAENVYDLGLGNPDVPAPAEVDLVICDILKEEESTFAHGYMSNADHEDVRQAVAESLNRCFGMWFHQNGILMIVGTANGSNATLKILLNPGGEVIVFVPYFAEYGSYIHNYSGNPVVVSPDTTDFEPNLAELEQKINVRTKAITVNIPNNLTRVVYSSETFIRMVNIMRIKEEELGIIIVLLSDEPYKELTYDGVEVPHVTNVYDNTITCYSYSKSLSLPGEHIGYLVIPDALKSSREVFNATTTVNQVLGCVNTPSLIQRVTMRCLDAKINLEVYDRNRNLLYNGLKDPGLECIKPQGAFYLFVRSLEADKKKLCENCKKYNILMAPGTPFVYPGYVWISYCVSYEQTERSLPIFVKAITDYGLKR